MAWIKRATPVENPSASSAQTVTSVPEEPPKKKTRRYAKNGERRGQRPQVAVVGLIVLIFAVIGVVATVVTGFRIIHKARDTSYLKEDMYYTLLPLMQYAPTSFENPNDSKQDALIQAALYQITNREGIRQQQDSEYVSPYKTDDFGRMAVPITEVTKSYNQLFGTDTLPYCHTFGDDAGIYFTYEYDQENQLYYVPQSFSASAYEPAIDTIRRAGNTYKVRVGYIHLQDVTVDDYGNKVIDIEKATYFQIYTVERLEDDHFVIRAVTDEKKDEK